MFREKWHIAYLVVNAVLYGIQLALYILLFFSGSDDCNFGTLIRQLIYYTIAVMNLIIPLIVLVVRIYFSLKFAGKLLYYT